MYFMAIIDYVVQSKQIDATCISPIIFSNKEIAEKEHYRMWKIIIENYPDARLKSRHISECELYDDIPFDSKPV